MKHNLIFHEKVYYKLLWILLSLLFLAAIFFSARFGYSNIYFFKAEQEISNWGHDGSSPKSEQVDGVLVLIDQALTYWPDNPDYLVLKARALGWSAYINSHRDDYVSGINNLRLANRSRPAHAYTWALLAEFKVAVDQRDNELYRSIENALRFGGHDIEIVKRMDRLINQRPLLE